MLFKFFIFLKVYSIIYIIWRKIKEYCKGKENYLIGNFILLNIIMVCIEFNYNNISLGWIGVVCEVIKMKDKGNVCFIYV